MWKPWGTEVTIEFRRERMALRFEKYLKSGAGHAFASSHVDPGRLFAANHDRLFRYRRAPFADRIFSIRIKPKQIR